MKKHLVLITGRYFPTPSPTGKCAHAYINLLKKDYDVEVICVSSGEREPYEWGDEKIHPIGNSGFFFRRWAERKFRSSAVNTVLKLPGVLIRPFTHPKIFGWFGKMAWKRLEEIHRRNPVDLVFSACGPVAAHAAALRFKNNHPEVRWLAYTVDSYAAQQNGAMAKKSAMRYERKLLSGADRILLSQEIFDSMETLRSDFEGKCSPLPYLMPERQESETKTVLPENGKINLVYVGRFYKKLRRPEFLLETAEKLGDKYVLNLFSGGACADVVKKIADRANGRIIIHPWASPEEINAVYAQADILVNVGNSVPEFKPSKLFEYISTGKPIINFYYPGLIDDELAKNPLALQVEMIGNPSDNTEKIRRFIDEVCGKKLSEKEIEEIYRRHSKEYISEILYECAE